MPRSNATSCGILSRWRNDNRTLMTLIVMMNRKISVNQSHQRLSAFY